MGVTSCSPRAPTPSLLTPKLMALCVEMPDDSRIIRKVLYNLKHSRIVFLFEYHKVCSGVQYY